MAPTVEGKVRRLWGKAIWIVAAVALLAASARAQNLDAGKSPAQLYSEVCAACHKSVRELKRPSASFLRQHYTTSGEAATAIAGYLAGVAADPRAAQPKRPPGSLPAAPAATANAAATAESPRTAPEREQAKQLPKGKRPPAGVTADAGKPAAELSPPEPPRPPAPVSAAPPPPVLEPFYE